MNDLEILERNNHSVSTISNLDTADISDQAAIIFTWVMMAGVCPASSIFGIITNLINIVCFIKQGFKEPVNISLLGLAISDLGCLVTLVSLNTFYALSISASDVSFDVLEVLYLVVAMPHLAFSRITSWITALITLERCLCIIAPLKVKVIVTTKRTTCVIICVFLVLLFSGSPVYVVNKLDLKFYPERNRTLLGIISTEDREQVEKISFAINSFFVPFAAFIVITICTIILVINLQKREKWQKTCTTGGQHDVSNRNEKVAKMVTMISALFITLFVPLAISMLAFAFEPELTIGGKYANIGTVIASFVTLLESINSSANIFIYYQMSSKYRESFNKVFGI